MPTLIVLEDPADWELDLPDTQVVSARAYLTDPLWSDRKQTKVFNLCHSFRYQSLGYYVSLLAAARGHRPIPSVSTMQDMKSLTIVRSLAGDLGSLIEKSLHGIKSSEFTLSIYFGRNVAKSHDALARALYNLFPAPLMRAQFTYDEGWSLESVRAIPTDEVPSAHKPFFLEAAKDYFTGKRPSGSRKAARFQLAILHDPEAAEAPSNPRAIKKFVKAAEQVGFGVRMLTKEDYGRIVEHDALFIRTTTAVNHYTYRFSRRAANEGLVVIDSPDDILRCTNKVYQAEILQRHGIAIPNTMVVHKGNVDRIARELGLPCVLKQPDSAFSHGVIKVETEAELSEHTTRLFASSELLVAQRFLPTAYDWRVGVFDRRPIYCCRYHMAKKHWQIAKSEEGGKRSYGRVEWIARADAPASVLDTAVRAANLIGDGLYGVDLKEIDGRAHVIEINDNPNIDAGLEDQELDDELYLRIMQGFLRRVQDRQLQRGGA